jgi:hypothetical protein
VKPTPKPTRLEHRVDDILMSLPRHAKLLRAKILRLVRAELKSERNIWRAQP